MGLHYLERTSIKKNYLKMVLCDDHIFEEVEEARRYVDDDNLVSTSILHMYCILNQKKISFKFTDANHFFNMNADFKFSVVYTDSHSEILNDVSIMS